MGAEAKRGTLYLVDGTSQLFRAYYAIRGLSNAEGLPTNAVYGFTTMLRKLLKEEAPEYVAVAFDLAGPTFRHDRYADYKANRPPAPEDLVAQGDYAKDVCRALEIPVLELEGYEADDLIATYARLAREAGFEVVIVASDKDLLQLVGEGVVVLNPVKNQKLDAAGVEASFGVPPARVLDVLALMGDSVDNIPGVPGVGEKSAKEMVAAHGGLDAVLARADRLAEAFGERDALVLDLETLPSTAAVGEPALDRVASRAEALARGLEELAPGAGEDHRGRLDEAARRLRALAGRLASGSGARSSDLAREARALARALKDLDKGSGRRLWSAVREHRDRAALSRDLARLDSSVPAGFDPEVLRLGPPDRQKLRTLFSFLGFRSLLEEMLGGESGGTGESAVAPGDEGRGSYRTLVDLPALREAVSLCREAGRFALDTECVGADPQRARLVGISVSWAEGEGAYLPLAHEYPAAPEQLPFEVARAELLPLLGDASVGKIAHDLKHDLHVLRRHGIPVEGWRLDTMVAAFLLEPDRPGFGLGGLARAYLRAAPTPLEDVAGKDAVARSLDQVEVGRVAEYAAERADVALRLAHALEPRLREAGLIELYEKVDGPLLPVLARMEAHGISVDVEKLGTMAREMEGGLERARRDIHELAGTSFNVDSPKQLREILFERLGLEAGRLTPKGGVPSTDAETLEDLAKEHEIARRLLEYREISKLKSNYVDSLPGMIHPGTGRIHTSYHPTGAATGRLSSSEPNLQNIPARSEAGRRIRSAFVPEKGFMFLSSDYSQMELRVLAHLCGDPELLAAFEAGEDVHRVTAARVFGMSPALVTDEMRRRAKAVNFGILYGMSETRLAREQRLSRAEARRFIATYFARFQGVRAYIEMVREAARREGEVRTLFGRVRRFPQLRRRSGRAIEEQALRAAVNTTIQGTAADLMKMAMLRAETRLVEAVPRARMLLQVHDELLFEVPEGEVSRAAAVLREAMEQVHPLRAPLAVDQKSGGSWVEVT